MASEFPETPGSGLQSRIGHDMNWACDTHSEPIKFICESHNLAVCHPCAFKDHRPCQVSDIEVVIKKLEKQLEGRRVQLEEAKRRLTELGVQVKSCNEFAKKHVESLKNDVKSKFEKEIEIYIEKEKKEVQIINEEAGEKIRLIIEDREKQLRKCHERAEKLQKPIYLNQKILLEDIKHIDSQIQEKIKTFQNECEITSRKIKDSEEKISKLLKDKKDLVNYGTHVIAMIDETLKINEQKDVVKKIKRAVQMVRFSTGKMNGEFYGRIDGYIGEWKLVDTISIPENVRYPFIVGLAGEDEIVISEYAPYSSLSVTRISRKDTQKAMGSDTSHTTILTCARIINSDAIVCGKRDRTVKSLERYISIYDRQWKLIRDITIPISKTDIDAWVYVDVDKDGMILAAQRYQSNIYIINPDDGKTVKTITVTANKVWGRIRALSSGDIVVPTEHDKFTVISRSGSVEACIHDDTWDGVECIVDQLTDTLYVTYWDRERGVRAVDKVSCDGVILAKRIVEYAESQRSPTFVTPSGKLVTSNGNTVLIYKKSVM